MASDDDASLVGELRRLVQRLNAMPDDREPSLTPLGHGLHLHDGEVVLGAGRREGGHLTLLRAAAAAASRGALIGPTTLANLVASCGPLPAPWPREIREGFVGFLASGPGIVDVWEGLDLSGIVDVWLPEWSAVRSRPQRNAIHQFTVDRHSIEAVVVAAGLREHVARPDLLLVAALLHDIGKVAGARDHSAEGAPVARAICERMGFDRADCDLVERLVREHLTLVDLATKRDPDDPATVKMLCEAAGSAEGLDLLEALTEADARAAGPQAWTTWRAGLVRDLADRAPGTTLEQALRGVLTRAEALGPAPSWELRIDGEPAVLAPAQVETLHRAAQSLVANVQQHAEAQRCVLTLGWWPDRVSLDVVDDGRGFDPGALPAAPTADGTGGGDGLRLLRARLDRVPPRAGAVVVLACLKGVVRIELARL